MAQQTNVFETSRQAAQALTLVRAVEETDRQGELLAASARAEATRAALAEADDETWPVRRAQALKDRLAEVWTFLPRLLRLSDPGQGLAGPTLIAAVLLGLSTNALGPDRQVHVLALPLAGILAWNVSVLVLMALRRVVPMGASAWQGSGAWFSDLVMKRGRRWAQLLPAEASGDPELVRQSMSSYLRDWFPVVRPLVAARCRRLLHLASVAVLAGVVGGMYVRGLGFAYEATWESTFISRQQAASILGAVLGPASWVTGIEVPEPVYRPVGASSSAADAAPWIHLWAVSALLYAGLPRLALAAVESLRLARLDRKLSVKLPNAYLSRLRSAVSPDVLRLELIPYSYRMSAATVDTLRARLLDVFGARCKVHLRSPVEYGSEADEADVADGHRFLVVFNLAQTPEVEVQADFVAGVARQLREDQELDVIVDGSTYLDRVGEDAAGRQRRDERRRTWDRTLSTLGVEALHIDLRRDSAEQLIDLLSQGSTKDGR